MENFVSLEVWAVMAAAPCIVSWFLGEMHGAARTRKMIDGNQGTVLTQAIRPGQRVAGAMPLAAKPGAAVKAAGPTQLAGSGERTKTPTAASPGTADTVAAPAGQSAKQESVQSLRRRAAFHDMPSIAELHSQAQKIRKSGKVWDDPELSEDLSKTDPISARVLHHYRGSINALARYNAEVDRINLVPDEVETNERSGELSRCSDAASA